MSTKICPAEYPSTDQVIAILTFLALILSAIVTIYTRKALYGNTISNSRPPYIDSLRKSFANLHAELTRKEIEENEFYKAYYNVLYHFNEFEEMEIDKSFLEFLKNIFEKVKSNDKIDKNTIENYRSYSSAILQYEWDNFKKEIKKGTKLSHAQKLKTKSKTIDKAVKNFN